MKIFTRFIFAIVFAFSFTTVAHLNAQSADQKKKKPVYRKARVLQASTAKKIVKIVEALEQMDDIAWWKYKFMLYPGMMKYLIPHLKA